MAAKDSVVILIGTITNYLVLHGKIYSLYEDALLKSQV